MKKKSFRPFLLMIVTGLLLHACGNKKVNPDAWGNFEADDIVISAETSGKIIYFGISEGMRADSGTVACITDTTELHLKKMQLAAQRDAIASGFASVFSQIEVYNQQIKNLNIEKNRTEALIKSGSATGKQLDDINGNIEVVRKQIASVQSKNAAIISEMTAVEKQIEAIGENIRKSKVQLPFSGDILNTYSAQHEFTSPGKPLFRIADLSEIILRVYVSGNQLSTIKTGDICQVYTDDGSGGLKEFSGIIFWISPVSEFTPKIIQTREERVNLVYAVKIRVKNDGSLKIGMPGEVRFSKQPA